MIRVYDIIQTKKQEVFFTPFGEEKDYSKKS